MPLLNNIGTPWHGYNLVYEAGIQLSEIPRPETPDELIDYANRVERLCNIIARQANDVRIHGYIEALRIDPFCLEHRKEPDENGKETPVQP